MFKFIQQAKWINIFALILSGVQKLEISQVSDWD